METYELTYTFTTDREITTREFYDLLTAIELQIVEPQVRPDGGLPEDATYSTEILSLGIKVNGESIVEIKS